MAVVERSFLYYGRSLLAHSPVYLLAFLSLLPLRARRHQRGMPHDEVSQRESANHPGNETPLNRTIPNRTTI